MSKTTKQKIEERLQARMHISWESLTATQQQRVNILLAACHKMDQSCNRQRDTPIIAALASSELASLQSEDSAPVSAKTLERLFYWWRSHENNWRVLLDGRRVCKLYSSQHTNNAKPTPT